MSPKSRKRKRHSRKAKGTSKTIPVRRPSYHFEWVPPSPESRTQEEVDRDMIALGEEHQVRYEHALAELQSEILRWDPVQLLATTSFYSSFDPNVDIKRPAGTTRVFQHNLEFLQALLLRNSLNAFDIKIPPPEAVDKVRKLLVDCSKSYPLKRFAQLDTSMSDAQRHRMRVLGEIRGHTQSVRNWGYPQQIKHIVSTLVAPLDDEVESQAGIRLQHLVTMWFEISSLILSRFREHVTRLAPIKGARSIKEAVDIFWSAVPQVGKPEDMIGLLTDHDLDLQKARYFLLSYSDRLIPEIYTLSLADFLSKYPTPIEDTLLKHVLVNWSSNFGDLFGSEPENLFLANPIWHRPLINTDGTHYFLPLPGLFLGFPIELIESVIRTSAPDLMLKYERRRAKFLEEEIERLFTKAFPTAKSYRGSLWHDAQTGKEFENDLLVLIDSFQIVIEAKSGKFSDPARRGAPARLEKELQKLIIDPSLQAKRFSDYLESNRGTHQFTTRAGTVNQVDNTNCRATIRLNVTLDMLANVQARWTDLRRAELVPQDADLGVTLSLADLDLIFDLLDTSCEKIHYLARRSEFERNAEYLADEADLLAFYVDNGFNIGEMEYDGTPFVIYGMSDTLAPYYMSRWAGKDHGKPKRPYTKWYRMILDRMDREPVARWSEIGYMLLSLSFEEQIFFEQEFRRVRKNVSKPKPKRGLGNAYILLSGPKARRNAIIGLAYKTIPKEKRDSMMAEAAIPAFQKEPIDRALAIGVNVERVVSETYPYGFLTCVFREALSDYL